MQEKVIYRWHEVQPQVVELLAVKGKSGELIPKESIPDLLNHKNKSIERLAMEIWPFKKNRKKLVEVGSQVLELRALIDTMKVMLGNALISDAIKLELVRTFPDDLTAFADGLDQILADFHHDGFDQQAFDPDLIADEVLGDG